MNQVEKNISKSFKLVKGDIIRLQNDFLSLSKNQKKIMEFFNTLRDNQIKLNEKIKKLEGSKSMPSIVIKNKKNKQYVATKDGKKFHVITCPFAKNIKAKNKVKFSSMIDALNQGYKACKCIK